MAKDEIFRMKPVAVVFLCVIVFLSSCVASKASDNMFVEPLNTQHTSYFDVWKGLSETMDFMGDQNNLNSLQNISINILHFFHRANDFVFSEDRNAFRDVMEVLTSSKYNELREQYYRDVIDKIHHQQADNTIKKESFIPPQILTLLERENGKEEIVNLPSTCINDTGRIITGLVNKDPWAVQFFDAAGKPGPSITQLRISFAGNYDQCRAAMATARPEDASRKDAGKFSGKYGTIVAKIKTFPLEARLGVCFPDTCSDLEINILVYQLFRLQSKLPLQYAYFMDQTVRTEMTPAAKAAISILSIIGAMMVAGTLYDLVFVQKAKQTDCKTGKSSLVTNMNSVDATNSNSISNNGANPRHQTQDEVNRKAASSFGEKAPLLPTQDHDTNSSRGNRNKNESPTPNISTLSQILLSFSVYSNAKKLLNTKQVEGSLGAIHGIRFLSMSWVVLCHMFAFCSSYAVNFVTAYSEFLGRWTFVVVSNGFVSVDTFFTLSGLLTSYLTIKEMTRKNTWKINWPLFYFHRFWRLTPPYMFSLVIVLGLSQFLGQGALWSNEQPSDRKNCEDNWWTNLLYVNNLVNVDKGCFGHSWYLANDMQFFVLSPLMMVPFFFHKAAGVISCLVFLVTSWITTGVLSHDRKWPTTTSSLNPAEGRAGVGSWFNDYYVVPWCRIGPFIVGILAGYILARTNGRQFKMPRWFVISGWIITLATGLAVVYGLYGDIKGDNPSSLGASAFYNAVNRSAWGACVSWVIIACSAGYGGPVNTLLSWSPFVVLGRLTYMSYLIHICIVYTFYGNLDTLFSFNDTTMVIYFLGILVFVNLSAFVSVLVLESPMLGLEKALIKRRE